MSLNWLNLFSVLSDIYSLALQLPSFRSLTHNDMCRPAEHNHNMTGNITRLNI